MSARVLFFGATADLVGARTLDILVANNLKPAQILEEMVNRFPALAAQKLHLSINQEYATGDEDIHDGDELAVFTPVSGG